MIGVPLQVQDWMMMMMMMEGATQEIEELSGMIDPVQVLRERHGQDGMTTDMTQEGEGQILMTEKVVPGSKGQTKVPEGILCAIEWQTAMRTMVDQDDRLGVADQCLQKSIDIGVGMNLTHHQGHPEVQHIVRCGDNQPFSPYFSIIPYVTWLPVFFCCMYVPCCCQISDKLHPNEQDVRKLCDTLEYQLDAVQLI